MFCATVSLRFSTSWPFNWACFWEVLFIVFHKRPGDTVAAGERVGLIKFGSRVDVLFGPEWEIVVRPGMRVAAGSSVIARRRQEQPHGA